MLTVRSFNGEYDRSIIREVPREYAGATAAMHGAMVLDIGAHIGCFAVHALNSGAAHVVCLEPGLPSYRHLVKNVRPAGDRCETHHAGVTAMRGQTEMLLRYLSHRRSMAGAKTVKDDSKKGWNGIPFTYERVPAILFSDLLSRYHPAVVKLDCEGLEYDCVRSLKKMPQYVRTVVVEWHKTQTRAGIQAYLECVAKMLDWGFVPEKEPNLKIQWKGREAMGSNQFFIRPITWSR